LDYSDYSDLKDWKAGSWDYLDAKGARGLDSWDARVVGFEYEKTR